MGKRIRILSALTLMLTAVTSVCADAPRLSSDNHQAPYFLYSLDTAQSAVGRLNVPMDVAIAPDGTIYVLDSGNHRVQRFSSEGTFLTAWGSHGAKEGQFNRPERIAVAPDGTVYVADTWNHRIQRFAPDGRFLGARLRPIAQAGQFSG